MAFNINLNELYKSEFGLTVNKASQKFIDKQQDRVSSLEPLSDSRDFVLTSGMGVPVWDIVEIEPLIEDGTGSRFEGFAFPAEMTIEAIRPKKVVETDIIGLEGMVEELVSMDDWQLTFKGFIINYRDESYPFQGVLDLQRACELKHSTIPVISEFMNLLGINYVSIHNLRLPQLAGYSNVQPFEVMAKSKKPFIVSIGNGIVL